MAKYHSRPSAQYRYEHYDPCLPGGAASAGLSANVFDVIASSVVGGSSCF